MGLAFPCITGAEPWLPLLQAIFPVVFLEPVALKTDIAFSGAKARFPVPCDEDALFLRVSGEAG